MSDPYSESDSLRERFLLFSSSPALLFIRSSVRPRLRPLHDAGDDAAREEAGLLGRLILEVTEHDAMQSVDQTIDFMDHVRATGCAFALDDFGAGATGFKYFRDFRFDMVKIDGAFIRGVHVQPDAQVLVEALAGVARHFEMLTIAEFVETEAEAGWLRERGIDCLQGHLCGRPAARPQLPGAGEAGRRAIG